MFILFTPNMNIHAHKEIQLHLDRGDENVRVFWKHLFEDNNTYAVQFILTFNDITVDCIYCFTDGFSHTMIINTQPVLTGEIYDKIIPMFVQIYQDRKIFN